MTNSFVSCKQYKVCTTNLTDSHSSPAEHSIHPPPCKDPWYVEFLPDNGYKVQMVKGVYQVGWFV